MAREWFTFTCYQDPLDKLGVRPGNADGGAVLTTTRDKGDGSSDSGPSIYLSREAVRDLIGALKTAIGED